MAQQINPKYLRMSMRLGIPNFCVGGQVMPFGGIGIPGTAKEFPPINPEGLAEFAFMNKYLNRVMEDNNEAEALGIDEVKAMKLIMAYQSWIRTFRTDGSMMSVRLMQELMNHIKETAPEDYQMMEQYYFSDDHDLMEKSKATVMEIWEKYRTFGYCYKYSHAFKEAADKWGAKVDEGKNLMERVKLFYLWLVIFDGKEKLFADMGDSKIAQKNNGLVHNLEFLIGFSDSKCAAAKKIMSLKDGDIVVAQMRAFLDFVSSDLKEQIWGIIAISEDNLSSAKVPAIRECKRRMFASAPKSKVSPYDFCTKSGIAELDAEKFIADARKLERKKAPTDWVEHITLATYKWLEVHGDFCFGKGNDKKPLKEWLIVLGYEEAKENASTNAPSDYVPVQAEVQQEVIYKDLSPEETWAQRCCENIGTIAFPMPEGAWEAMEKAIKIANQCFGDEMAMRNALGNKYIWVEFARAVAEKMKDLRREWGKHQECKKLLRLVENSEGIL